MFPVTVSTPAAQNGRNFEILRILSMHEDLKYSSGHRYSQNVFIMTFASTSHSTVEIAMLLLKLCIFSQPPVFSGL